MKRTPLYSKHLGLKARMAEFGGYEMPIQYGSVLREHEAARSSSAIFDTCHMGEFIIKGKRALKDLERIVSCDVEPMKKGSCRYGFICNEFGGVKDDQILYRIEEQAFFMVVNASTELSDYNWIKENISPESEIENISLQTGKIDIQGPKSPGIVKQLLEKQIDGLNFFRFEHNYFEGEKVLVSRTGYTGEIGFEIYCPKDITGTLWDKCVGHGATPAGLAARNTLRLEMGYPLYGHELSEEINASWSNMSYSISRKKMFIGSEAIHSCEKKRTLCAIISRERKSAAEGNTVTDRSGKQIGFVTSGSYSPSLHCSIALAYIDSGFLQQNTPVKIITDRQSIDAEITSLPFYKDGTARKKIEEYL